MKEIADEPSGTRRIRRKAVRDVSELWPQGVMPYELHPDLPLSMKTTVMAAMKHWEDNTCIEFREYSPEVAEELGHHDRVLFRKGDGCTSNIGRNGDGVQETSIGTNCNILGSVAHEIGHSLGYYHEQSRPDRDEHVTINFANVAPSMKANFLKYGYDHVRTDEPYDVGSIMHYGPTFLSRDGQSETISPKQRALTGFMGQRKALSFLDIKTANELYQCNAHCSVKPICLNAGFVNERCRCSCPFGVSGKLCETVASSSTGCGGVLKESSGIFRTRNYPRDYGDRVVCNWLIEGPKNSNITLEFDHFETEADNYAPCGYDWLEIRNKGPEVPGLKFCGTGPEGPLHFTTNLLFLQFRSDEFYNEFSGFQARYKIESPPDYIWADFSDWSPCSARCGGGSQIRKRDCLKGHCEGMKFEFRRCNIQPC
ncbi:hypothetical protein LOTGIDRAFT_220390 [Lottia gigantea]|uniref:Metalloendopeptidase n=1 Tax=Lottia gigantea TaxID=225164 RepID=V4BDN0_LOTGI|nr:hypothetical protein LOTGIDRAFT_220390 [Lottia gigantea]ESO86849.1 hypothetical protein LOTGIDRAFT_220390 [Lottia gigantea]